MPITRDQKTELLAATPLFEGLEPEELGRIADRTVETDYRAGGVIVREGEIGTGFFVIVSGSVGVVRDGQTVGKLGPGEFFGELSVLDRRPRNAQVVATGPTSCLALASLGPRSGDHRAAHGCAGDARGSSPLACAT